MKQTIAGIILLLTTATTSCCLDKHTLKGEGSTISDERSVASFHEVAAEGSIETEIYPASDGRSRIVVSGYQNLVTAFDTKVSGDKLILKFKDNYWNIKNNNIVIRIYTSGIERIDLNGSGKVEVMDDLNTNYLETNINGSGFIGIYHSDFNELHLKINGSGEINSSSSDAREVSAEISGSGDITTRVSDRLYARIWGSGSIAYYGNPRSIDTRVEGSGSIKRK